MYMDIKVFAENEKKPGDPDTINKNIQLGYRNEVRYWKYVLWW